MVRQQQLLRGATATTPEASTFDQIIALSRTQLPQNGGAIRLPFVDVVNPSVFPAARSRTNNSQPESQDILDFEDLFGPIKGKNAAPALGIPDDLPSLPPNRQP